MRNGKHFGFMQALLLQALVPVGQEHVCASRRSRMGYKSHQVSRGCNDHVVHHQRMTDGCCGVGSGAIVGGEGGIGGTGSVITAGAFIKQLRSLGKNKSVQAVVLRVDSPGGDALASDLMWREIRKLAEKKPVVASMGDVAASGG